VQGKWRIRLAYHDRGWLSKEISNKKKLLIIEEEGQRELVGEGRRGRYTLIILQKTACAEAGPTIRDLLAVEGSLGGWGQR